jgi:hypothetical protein
MRPSSVGIMNSSARGRPLVATSWLVQAIETIVAV